MTVTDQRIKGIFIISTVIVLCNEHYNVLIIGNIHHLLYSSYVQVSDNKLHVMCNVAWMMYVIKATNNRSIHV